MDPIIFTAATMVGKPFNSLMTFTILYFGSWEDGWPIIEEMMSYKEEHQSHPAIITNLTSMAEYARINPLSGDHRTFVAGTFVTEENLVTEGDVLPLAEAMLEATPEMRIGTFFAAVGGLYG